MVVSGTLGPTHSRWNDEYGWVEIVDWPIGGERTLYAVVWFTRAHDHMNGPVIDARDEAGQRVVMEPLLRKTHGYYEDTGMFVTKKPHRGTLRVRLRSRLSSSARATSGRYAVCVAYDATSCLAKAPDAPLVQYW
jgi:hypothetical protein